VYDSQKFIHTEILFREDIIFCEYIENGLDGGDGGRELDGIVAVGYTLGSFFRYGVKDDGAFEVSGYIGMGFRDS
jgi:hypothetical protein